MELYSPVRGPKRHDEYHMTGKVHTTVKPLDEIEAYLQERWPGQIQPIKGPLRNTSATHKKKNWNNFALAGSNPKK